jgi:hypothetical protein
MSRTKRNAPNWILEDFHERGADDFHFCCFGKSDSYEDRLAECEKLLLKCSTDKTFGSVVGGIQPDVEKPDLRNDDHDGPISHEIKTDYSRYWRRKNKLKLKKSLKDDID